MMKGNGGCNYVPVPVYLAGTRCRQVATGGASVSSLHVMDHVAVGWAFAWQSIGFDILHAFSIRALDSLDSDCFNGLFSYWTANRSRPREWMPRLEPLAIVEQSRN